MRGAQRYSSENGMFPEGDFRNWYFRGDRKKQVVEHVDALRADLPEGETVADTALRLPFLIPRRRA